MRSTPNNIHWLWLAGIIVALDQWTKLLVVRRLQLFEEVPLLPHLSFRHMQNTGAAFSMLRDLPPAAFIVLGAVVSAWILLWLRRHPQDQRLIAAALSLILGGALGNATDRAMRGSVVDFVDVYAAGWHFPAFNLADSAITLGAALLILDMLREHLRSRPPAPAPDGENR